MKISCPKCPAVYELDDSRIPAAGLSIKCPKCQSPFTVAKPKPGAATTGPVPLPGTGAPASAAPPAGARAPVGPASAPPAKAPAAPAAASPAGAKGAVPLPGVQGSKPPPAAAAPATIIAPPPAGTRTGGPVPLPGTADGKPSALVPPAPPAAPKAPAVPAPAAGKPAVPLPGIKAPPTSGGRPPSIDPFADLDVDLGATSQDATPPIKIEPPAPPKPAVPLPGIAGAPPAAPKGAAIEEDPFGLDLPPAPAPSRLPPAIAPPPASAPPPPAPAKPAAPALLPDDGGISFDFIDEPKQPAAPPPAAAKPFAPPKPSAPPPKAAAPASDPGLLDFIDDEPPPASRPLDADDMAVMPKPSDFAVVPKAPETHVMPKAAPDAVTPKNAAALGRPSRPPPPVMTPGGPPVMTPGASSASARGSFEDETFQLPTPAADVAAKTPGKLGSALGGLKSGLSGAASWVSDNKKVVLGAAAGLLVIVVAGLGVRAGSTDAGWFWINKINPRQIATGAGRKAIDVAADKLAEGNFLSTRAALGTAAQVLQGAPDDDDVKAFFIMCASELKFMYGQGGVDWDLAQRTLEKLKGEGPKQVRARAAHALATGDAGKARSLLQPLVDRGAAEAQGTFLYAQALIRLKDWKGAEKVLDAGIKGAKTPSGKLLLARAMVARTQNQLPEAAQLLATTLERQPQNGRAMIELADVKRAQNDFPGALALLDKALQGDQKKALDASEEAKASLLRAQIFAARREHPQAEAAFERAVELDPQSVDIRGAYGAWRESRYEHEKALRHLEVALNKDGTNPKLIDPAVRALLGLNKVLEASKRVSEGLKRAPDDPNLLFLQGKVDEGFQKPTDAVKSYEAALKKKPDHTEALVAAAFQQLGSDDKEQREQAKKKLEAAEKSTDGKDRPSVHLVVGDLRLAFGDGAGARDHYAKALGMEPDSPLAHASLGRALSALGENDKAKAELEIALKSLEGDALLQYEYGSLLRRMGDAAAATGPLEKAVKLAPNDHRFRARLGALRFEQGDLPAAEKELRQAALLSEKWPETYFFLGRTYAAQKKLPEAVEQLKKAIELDQQNPHFHYELGLVYEMTRQIGDAIRSFTNAIERDSKMALAHEHIAKNYLLQNVYDDAIQHFGKAAELDPSRPELIALRADAEREAGQPDAAIEHYKQALAKNPRMPGLWSKLGVAFKEKACNECRRLAVQAFQRAEQVDPRDANARRELGYVYKEDGRRAEAIAQFKKYIELKPDAPDADQVKDDIYFLSEEKKRAP